MDLNDEQKESVKQYLIDKEPTKGGISCSVCQRTKWEIAPKIFQISEFQPDHIVLAGPRIPVISMMCTNCSNTLFFNAIALDLNLVPPSKKQEIAK